MHRQPSCDFLDRQEVVKGRRRLGPCHDRGRRADKQAQIRRADPPQAVPARTSERDLLQIPEKRVPLAGALAAYQLPAATRREAVELGVVFGGFRI